MNRFLLLIPIFLIAACGISQSDYDKVLSENENLKASIEQLKTEVDDCKYGAEKLLNTAQSYFDKGQYDDCRNTVAQLSERYPGSEEEKVGKQLLSDIDAALAKIEQEKAEAIASATKNMRTTYDDMNDLTWYFDKTSPKYVNQNGFFCYIGQQPNKIPVMKLKIQFHGDDWLFVEKYVIKADDQTFEITENEYGEIKTDHDAGKVWEWLTRTVTATEYKMLQAIANAKVAKIRYVGEKYYDDKEITSTQKKAISNVLKVYKSLGGNL